MNLETRAVLRILLRDCPDTAETVRQWLKTEAAPEERQKAFAQQLEQDFREWCFRPSTRKNAGLIPLLVAAAIRRVNYLAVARRLLTRFRPRADRPAWDTVPSAN
jgi:hypothetical protein